MYCSIIVLVFLSSGIIANKTGGLLQVRGRPTKGERERERERERENMHKLVGGEKL